jgi:hypothetical protein
MIILGLEGCGDRLTKASAHRSADAYKRARLNAEVVSCLKALKNDPVAADLSPKGAAVEA